MCVCGGGGGGCWLLVSRNFVFITHSMKFSERIFFLIQNTNLELRT